MTILGLLSFIFKLSRRVFCNKYEGANVESPFKPSMVFVGNRLQVHGRLCMDIISNTNKQHKVIFIS